MIRTVPLSDLLPGAGPRAKIQQGWSPQCLAHPAPETSWGVLKTTAIQSGEFVPHENKELPEHFEPRPGLEVRAGDLLLTCAGPRSRCGIPALVRMTRPRLMISGKMYRFRPDPDAVDPRYLELYLQSPAAQTLIDAMKTGISDSGLNLTKERFLGLPVPVAPLPEQQRIVDILEDHLSRLDAANDYLDAAERRLDRLALARWRSVFGALAEELGQRPLLDVASIENGQTPRGLSDRLLDHEVGDSVPFYKVGDMNASEGRAMAAARFHARQQDARELGLHVRQGGLVLIPKRGGAISTNKKRLLTSPAAFDLNTMGLRPKRGLSPEYLWHWLEGIDLGQIADGSNVPQINAPQVRRLLIPVPPDDVQAAVTHKLDAFAAQREAAALECQRARHRSDRLRRALLAAAFSGRLTGHSSDLDRGQEVAFS